MATVLAQPKNEAEASAQAAKAQQIGVPDPIKQERLKQLWSRRSELTTEQRLKVEQALQESGISPEESKQMVPPEEPGAMQVLNEDYVQPAMEGLKTFGKENALPLGMQLGAQALGSRLGIPTSVSGPAGAAAGTYLNYMTGITKPPEESLTGLPTTLEGPLATGLLTAGANLLTKPVLTNLPGSQAGRQEIGTGQLQKLESSVRPPTPRPSSAMYDALATGPNPKVPMGPLSSKLVELRKEFGDLARNQKLGPTVAGKATDKSSGIIGKIKSYQDNLTYYRGGWPIDKLRNEMKALNGDIGAAEASGGAELGALRSMKKAMWESLEQSGTSSAPLRKANQQFMHEIASDELADILQKKGMSFKQTHGYLLPEVNPAAIKNALEKLPEDSLITKHLKAQLPAIQKTLDELAAIPKLESEGSISTKLGSPGRLIAGAAAGAGGALFGGGMVGTAAGAATGIAAYEAISKLLMSPRGRSLIVNVLKAQNGHWTSTTTSLLVNAASHPLYDIVNPSETN
jgi:hypothetical protein